MSFYLRAGDLVRVIAPSMSMSIISEEVRKRAIAVFENDLGLRISFGRHVDEDQGTLRIAPLTSRLEDFHEAFADTEVKAIFTCIGGFSSNDLLSWIDWDLVNKNPKIFCGFSDITALSMAIYTKTGMRVLSGPRFSSLGMKEGLDYTIDYLKKVLFGCTPILLAPANHFSDDAWYLPSCTKRTFHDNSNGNLPLRSGKASGIAIGGNISVLSLIYPEYLVPIPTTISEYLIPIPSTIPEYLPSVSISSSIPEYLPSVSSNQTQDWILFLEDDSLVKGAFRYVFRQLLVKLLSYAPLASNLGAIIIGRCCVASEMTDDAFEAMLKDVHLPKRNDVDIPIVINASFGHTTPIFTIPIGSTITIDANVTPAVITIHDY